MLSKIKKNEKGFTLMEMLIVVAIIAVLIAIAIPTFNSSLNKAKVAADEANIRSGYATVMLKAFEDNTATAKQYILLKNGDVAPLAAAAPTDAYQTAGKQDSEAVTVAGIKVNTDGKWTPEQFVVYSYAADGSMTIATSATGTTTAGE